MKFPFLLVFVFFFALTGFAEPHQQTELKSGTWGGELHYQDQTTMFYLDIQLDENGDLIASTYMPVIPFPVRSIGTIENQNGVYSAGSIQFSLIAAGQILKGSFPNSPRDLTFQLYPIDEYPKSKESVNSGSTTIPAWTFKTNGPIWGDAAVDGDQLYIGSTDGYLYSISQSNGELKWKYNTNDSIFSRPLIQSNYVYILSDDGILHKLKTDTGSSIWTFDIGGADWHRKLPHDENPGYDSMVSAPVISDNIVYVGSADGHLFAINDNTGKESWSFKSDGPIHSIPIVAEGMVYFGSYDHHIYGLDAETGNMNWKFNTGQMIVSSPVYINGKVMIGSRSADLFALNASTGLEEWHYYHWGSWVESSGTVFDDLLYIGSSDDQLLKSFDPESGQLIWATNVNGSPWTTPAVTQSTVYTGVFGNANYGIDHHGGFYAIDRLTGDEKWRFTWKKLPETDIYGVTSSPAAANGMVFFGGLDGLIYGFQE